MRQQASAGTRGFHHIEGESLPQGWQSGIRTDCPRSAITIFGCLQACFGSNLIWSHRYPCLWLELTVWLSPPCLRATGISGTGTGQRVSAAQGSFWPGVKVGVDLRVWIHRSWAKGVPGTVGQRGPLEECWLWIFFPLKGLETVQLYCHSEKQRSWVKNEEKYLAFLCGHVRIWSW